MFVVDNKRVNSKSITASGSVSVSLKGNTVLLQHNGYWDYIGKNHTKYHLHNDTGLSIEVSTTQLNEPYHGIVCYLRVEDPSDGRVQKVVGVNGFDRDLTEDVSAFLQSVSGDAKWSRRAARKLNGGIIRMIINGLLYYPFGTERAWKRLVEEVGKVDLIKVAGKLVDTDRNQHNLVAFIVKGGRILSIGFNDMNR